MDDSRQIARRIFSQTLASIDIPRVFQRRITRTGNCFLVDDCSYDLSQYSEIKVVALGKAAHAMLRGFAQLFGDCSFSGIAVAPTVPTDPIPGISYFVGGHPLPNGQSFGAAHAALELLKNTSASSLVVFLVSGGGSALMELPLDPAVSLEDIRSLNQTLVTCGASIHEINIVRKHISAVKGGRLALAAPHATKLTLAISDVPLGKESALASGPTIPDPSTVADSRCILSDYNLADHLPRSIVNFLAASPPETPKSSHPAFANSQFCLLLTSHDLFHAAHHAAESEGFLTCCDNATDDWPLARAADHLLNQLADLRRQNPGQRVALIANGELSSKATGQGIGGRNSAFVLACVEKIAGQPITVLSAGTDGIDGNSPAAGAVADGRTLTRANDLRLSPSDFFTRSDAYTFFHGLGDDILTGPTGNNLRDLRILLALPL
ncbi:MAG: glycerate kinase [Candidatus Acidiferrum sp.]